MRTEHRAIQRWIKLHHRSTYRVAAEIDQQNYLPDRERHWYQPDVIMRDGKGEIKYIIEVENDPVRKTLVGASILADYSIGELKQKTKPRLIFVVYTEQGIRQIPNFKEKLKIAKHYCSHLEDIKIYSEKDFKALRLWR
jgi:hypothetical protein